MTDVTSGPGPSAADTLPGDVVRQLVEQHEEELEALAAELARARREAEEVEALVRHHPALGLLGPDEASRLVPPSVRAPGAAEVTATSGPPRTTVVRRPSARPSGPDPAPAVGDPVPTGPSERSAATRLVTSHWIWKAGVALTVVALLLLKFG